MDRHVNDAPESASPAAATSQAVDALRAAAADLASSSASIAADLLTRARALAPDGASDELAADHVDLLARAGRLVEARDAAGRLLARRPDGSVAVRARLALARTLGQRGSTGPAGDELVKVTDDRAPIPSAGRALCLSGAAYYRAWTGQFDVAATLAADAQRLATLAASDAPDLAIVARARATEALALVALADGRAAEGVTAARHAVASWQRCDIDPVTSPPQLTLCLALTERDELAAATDALACGRGIAGATGDVGALQLCAMSDAFIRLAAGAYDDARAAAEATLAMRAEWGDGPNTVFPLAVLAHVAFHCDPPELADAALGRVEAALSVEGIGLGADLVLWLRALRAEAAGAPAVARASLELAWAVLARFGHLLIFRSVAPRLVRLLVDHDCAAAAEVTAFVERAACRNDAPSVVGAARRCRGLLDGDVDMIVAAVDAYRAGPRMPDLAEAAEDALALLAASDRIDDAARIGRQALRTWESLGAVNDAARVASTLRGLGVRVRRSHGPGGVHGWAALTPTELRVVRLVGEGLTNRQIGARLQISRRTVESHLVHMFAKLGVSTRSQLAAIAAVHS